VDAAENEVLRDGPGERPEVHPPMQEKALVLRGQGRQLEAPPPVPARPAGEGDPVVGRPLHPKQAAVPVGEAQSGRPGAVELLRKRPQAHGRLKGEDPPQQQDGGDSQSQAEADDGAGCQALGHGPFTAPPSGVRRRSGS
jgi:hypothetical protein